MKDCLSIATGVIVTMRPNPKKLLLALCPEMVVTALTDCLVRKGMPFQEMHHISGACARKSEELKIRIDELTMEQLIEIDDRFEEDVMEVWNYEVSVELKQGNMILFIDEMHTVVGAGDSEAWADINHPNTRPPAFPQYGMVV